MSEELWYLLVTFPAAALFSRPVTTPLVLAPVEMNRGILVINPGVTIGNPIEFVRAGLL